MSHPIGWARCKIYARRLERKSTLTALEEAFLIMIEIRLHKIQFYEVQIQALSGINQNNQKPMAEIVEAYQELLLGKEQKREDPKEVQARKILAEETKKVFAARPISELKAMSENVLNRSPSAQSLMRHYNQNKKIYDHVKLTRK